jgi:hypothetical protein
MNNSNEIQTIKTARFQESIKGYTTGKDILSDSLTFLKKLSGTKGSHFRTKINQRESRQQKKHRL